MRNVGRQSIDATSLCWRCLSISRHSPPPFVDRCCVVAKVARAISLASAALFSNNHSRADLPLAGAGGLLVVNINQRLSPEPSLPPVLVKPQHALSSRLCNSHSNDAQLRCSARASLTRYAVFHTSHTTPGPLSGHKRY